MELSRTMKRTGAAALLLGALLPAACAPPTGAARPGAAPGPAATREEQFVDSLLSQMTLEEKAGQLNMSPGRWSNTGPAAPVGGEDQIRRGEIGSFLGVWGAQVTHDLQRIAVEQSRLHIPLLFSFDVIHGYRTIFPVPLAEASSWDPELAGRAARVAAVEAAAGGVQWTFAPMVDIARDPRWGRIVEGSGEDPFLGSALAAARVRGFQGTDLADSLTVAATLKHFAAYGAVEAGRDYNTVDMSERRLRDVYLPPFHAGVCVGAESVMPSFNEISGVPSHANHHLITDILRNEWGFDGVVVSDYTGIMELLHHGIAADSAEAARLALHAGVDVDMVSRIYLDFLPELVRQGRVPQSELDDAVRRVLRMKYDLGLFQDPYRYSSVAREQALELTPEHRAVARRMADESMVLLRNQGATLPLDRGSVHTLAVIGPLADDQPSSLGSWAGAGRPEDAVTVLAGLRKAVAPGTTVLYEKGVPDVLSTDSSGFAAAVAAAQKADAVVLVVGETAAMTGEATSRATIDLPGVQLQLAKAVIATGKPVVTVLMNGRPLTVDWLAEHSPALLESWFLGVETGNAVADVLFGQVNPSGKLPVTFPRVTGQIPIYYAHKNTGRPPQADQHYTSKYLDVPWTPLYPFGYGLSYTTFSYGAPRLSSATIGPDDTLRVAVDVTNTGQRAGTEVVQLYLRDLVGSVTRPVEQLRGFQRVELQPGQTKTVTFSLDRNDLAFYGLDMKRVAEPGWFTVSTGGSSADVKSVNFQLTTPDGQAVAVPEGCEGRS
ncbi:MAG TPA: beta-glucosidase BglX [Longimicrobiaceae bacterium]|nr:beta-glucosidase BglX [Longimicrobiaceae bacterium]